MAHEQKPYSGLWLPQSLTDNVDQQKMFIDNINKEDENFNSLNGRIKQSVQSFTALRAINTTDSTLYPDGTMVLVKSKGIFYLDLSSALNDDGMYIIKPAYGNGRWLSSELFSTTHLTSDINVYVSTTGSDITGDGSESNPYASIGKALGTISKDLGGYTAVLNISDGAYDEDVVVKGVSNGYIRLQRNGVQELNNLCNVKSIRVENCNSVSISGLNLTTTDTTGVFGTRTNFINVSSCQSVSNANTQVSFSFDYVSSVRVSGNRSLNHDVCLRAYASDIYSESWSADSIGNYGVHLEGSGKISKGNTFQPRGTVANERNWGGGIFISNYGAKIGSLSSNVNLYVATTGSDTTGNGTQSNPFKTIQFAIRTIPKDLGGYTVIINVADGTYPEVVSIVGFNNGEFRIYSSGTEILSDNCKVDRIDIRYNTCLIVVAGFSVMTTTYDGIVVESCITVNIQYIKIAGNALSSYKSGMAFYRCSAFNVWGCEVSYHDIALLAHNSRGISNDWAACVGNNYGLYSSYGSKITTVGAQPNATHLTTHDVGGAFTFNTGTQISGVYTSGLSCTWGNIQGGYILNGATGAAMVTVVFTVILSANLSPGTAYYIGGFPRVAGVSRVSVSVHDKIDMHYCFMNINGTLELAVKNTLYATTYLAFNCTYMTDQ